MFFAGFAAKCAVVYFPGAAVIFWGVGGRYWHLPEFRALMPFIIGFFFAVMLGSAYGIYFWRRSRLAKVSGSPFSRGWKAANVGLLLE
jgi:hypothetical protein